MRKLLSGYCVPGRRRGRVDQGKWDGEAGDAAVERVGKAKAGYRDSDSAGQNDGQWAGRRDARRRAAMRAGEQNDGYQAARRAELLCSRGQIAGSGIEGVGDLVGDSFDCDREGERH